MSMLKVKGCIHFGGIAICISMGQLTSQLNEMVYNREQGGKKKKTKQVLIETSNIKAFKGLVLL